MAKKIIALVAAIALTVCFAVSVSAEGVEVLTTTTYVGTEDVKVNVTVTGVDEGANVTYYATKGNAHVHVDQEKADATGASFEFNTKLTNLDSAVKVGYTAATKAEEAVIEGYTVAYPGGSEIIPTEATTVDFNWASSGAHYVFDGVEVVGDAVVSKATFAEGVVTVVFESIKGDVTITVNEKYDAAVTTMAVETIDAGAVLVAETEKEGYEDIKLDGIVDDAGNEITDETQIKNANADAVGDRKLTVLGKAKDADKYGIIVSENAITETTLWADEFETKYAADAYEGVTKNAEGLFAIQLIDTSRADVEGDVPFVEANKEYHTAVYAFDAAANAYVISAHTGTVTAK